MKLSREKSQPIFDRAMNVMVKGVSSNFRFLGRHSTPVIAKGKERIFGMLTGINSLTIAWDGAQLYLDTQTIEFQKK